MSNFEYLLSPINKIKGVGKKTLNSFNKKKIFTIFDLLWHLPISRIENGSGSSCNIGLCQPNQSFLEQRSPSI